MPRKGETMSDAAKRQLRRSMTKYKPALCGEIIDWFAAPRSADGWKSELFVRKLVEGQIYDGKVPVYIPTLTGFCDYIGISRQTLYKWVDTYPEFGDAYEEALEEKRDLINSYALAGEINPNFAKYMLESWHPRERRMPAAEGAAETQQGAAGAQQEAKGSGMDISVGIEVKLPAKLPADGEGEEG